MAEIFFTSDTHYGHKGVLGFCNRPFSSVEEMDSLLIKYWNREVGPKDTVYHLGDFAFANTNRVKYIRSQLNGTIHLIRGNHDYKWSKEAFSVFDSVENLKQIKVYGQTIILCHFPIADNGWNKARYGSWMLHGHAHCSRPFNFGIKRLDVGVDGHAYRPLRFSEVRSILTEQEDFKYKIRYEV